MHRPDHSTADPNGISSGVPGYTEGDPLVPTARTIVTDDQMNDVVEGLCRGVEGAGFALSKNDYDQIALAMKWSTSATYAIDAIAYTRKRFVTTSQGAPNGSVFGNNGDTLYVVIDGSGVYQYTLSTPYDISTATYASKFLDTTTQESSPQTLVFKPDGTEVYVAGGNARAYQYTLSTAWDISTAAYASSNADLSSQLGAVFGLHFNSDGTTLHAMDGTPSPNVAEYTLATPWSASTASYASTTKDVSGDEPGAVGFGISDDGLSLFVCGNSGDDITEYFMSTAWDVSTATASGRTYDISYLTGVVASMIFSHGGRIILISETVNDTIYQLSSMA